MKIFQRSSKFFFIWKFKKNYFRCGDSMSIYGFHFLFFLKNKFSELNSSSEKVILFSILYFRAQISLKKSKYYIGLRKFMFWWGVRHHARTKRTSGKNIFLILIKNTMIQLCLLFHDNFLGDNYCNSCCIWISFYLFLNFMLNNRCFCFLFLENMRNEHCFPQLWEIK